MQRIEVNAGSFNHYAYKFKGGTTEYEYENNGCAVLCCILTLMFWFSRGSIVTILNKLSFAR
jgi:hypothetical protein